MNICFVTGNKNKLAEASAILQRELISQKLDLPEIQAVQVEDVIEEKVKLAYQEIKQPVIVEDVGFYIKGWNDFPGALIKWAMKTLGNEGICNLMTNVEDKTVVTEACIGYYDGKKFKVFKGSMEGKIPEQPRGTNGFGFDAIFELETGKTLAELNDEEKNNISMRRIAFMKLKEYLN